MDWKEALLAKSREMGIAPAETENTETNIDSECESAFDPKKHPALHVVIERKGRAGKTATIIEGFECGEEDLKRIAGSLKSALGTGGSCRGGEILIQGECREKVRNELSKMGFRLKG